MVRHGQTRLHMVRHMVVIGVNHAYYVCMDLGDSSDLVVSHLGNEQVTNLS